MIKYKRVPNIKNSRYNKMYGRVLRCGHQDYELVWCTDLYESDRSYRGLCNLSDKVIYVDVSEEMEQTLLHEYLHALIHECGFKQREDWDRNLEEQLVEVFSQSLLKLFKIRRR